MNFIKKNSLYIAWVIALLAMCGSLFFSNVLHFPPCVLCWYQRILMYPLVLIIGIGILRKDKGIHLNVLPFSILGMLVALYHFLLYVHIIPDSLAPCSLGVSCTTKQIQWLGFINIPFMSLLAFIGITIMVLVYKNNLKQK